MVFPLQAPGECSEGMWEQEQGRLGQGEGPISGMRESARQIWEMEWGWRETWRLEVSLGCSDA